MAELPGYLKWLEWVAGSDWPAGDPDGMWGLADDWRAAATGLRDILPDIRSAKTASLKAYQDGDGIEAIIANFDSYLEGRCTGTRAAARSRNVNDFGASRPARAHLLDQVSAHVLQLIRQPYHTIGYR